MTVASQFGDAARMAAGLAPGARIEGESRFGAVDVVAAGDFSGDHAPRLARPGLPSAVRITGRYTRMSRPAGKVPNGRQK
jgi:hypothetical protein